MRRFISSCLLVLGLGLCAPSYAYYIGFHIQDPGYVRVYRPYPVQDNFYWTRWVKIGRGCQQSCMINRWTGVVFRCQQRCYR